MGNFCKNCGRPLQEGEVCNCTQQGGAQNENVNQNNQNTNQGYNGMPGYNNQYNSTGQNFHYERPEKKGRVPALLVPIGQTVAGGLLILFGLITNGFDWSYISYAAGAGFLLTGICGLVDAKK